MIQRTLAFIKPDAMHHSAEIISMASTAGLSVVKASYRKLTIEEIAQIYNDQIGRPHYDRMIRYLRRTPVQIMILEGEDAINVWRELEGNTRPWLAKPGTIRARFAASRCEADLIEGNIEGAVHGSDTPENAEREIAILFPEVT